MRSRRSELTYALTRHARHLKLQRNRRNLDGIRICPARCPGWLARRTNGGRRRIADGTDLDPVFGFQPSVAVETDLWFAAITKSAGGLVHHRLVSPNWRIACLLAMGSVPAAILTLIWLGNARGGRLEAETLMRLLGATLLLTAIITPMKERMQLPLARLRERLGAAVRPSQICATVFGAALISCLVTLTSVGAGALVAVMLMMLYPLRLGTKTVVGTDLVHAIPLARVGAIGHSLFGNVDWGLLGGLLFGSIPAIFAGP